MTNNQNAPKVADANAKPADASVPNAPKKDEQAKPELKTGSDKR